MKIAELFYSIQGEGKLTGVPSLFIRVSGCNLRCTWCDTPYASWHPEGRDLSLDQIVTEAETLSNAATHVVLTGGEPMLFKETVPLLHTLKRHGKHVTVETAGTLWPGALDHAAIDLASISPKLSNSTPTERDHGRFAQAHDRQRINLEVLRTFAAHPAIVDRQWKFVLSTPTDLIEMETLIATLNDSLPATQKIPPRDILLMPEGTSAQTLSEKSRLLAELCKQKGYRLSPRLHVYLWGNTRAT